MNTSICEMFGLEVPIVAFSHCRDVVVEVSRAGGLGVLGAARMSPERLHEELAWIDAHIDSRPYGLDVLMPTTAASAGDHKFDADKLFPPEQLKFVREMLDSAGIPQLPPELEAQLKFDLLRENTFTREESMRMIEVALSHPLVALVSGLGTPPKDVIDMCHARGIKVGALAGLPKHAVRHKEAGCDFVVAVGTEAAGHTGNVTSMVAWPRIVDAVAPMPVLGGGGVGRGRQVAAALALGCEGVWCGSIWLKTVQSEVTPDIKAKMFKADTQDAVLTKSVTGKQCRTLRSTFTDAWERPDAPPTLPAPLQGLLWWGEGRLRVERARATEFLTYPVGQIVGDMNAETSVRQVVQEMLEELVESKDRLDRIFG
ncbi:nitronate monooxygenase [Paraburkholderia sp. EG286B]|uniref:nitronate monooxygenase n=1 Tax=Paraburkholderia sp. EG286B TaxID=3237011 RepID=UPI0034D3574B